MVCQSGVSARFCRVFDGRGTVHTQFSVVQNRVAQAGQVAVAGQCVVVCGDPDQCRAVLHVRGQTAHPGNRIHHQYGGGGRGVLPAQAGGIGPVVFDGLDAVHAVWHCVCVAQLRAHSDQFRHAARLAVRVTHRVVVALVRIGQSDPYRKACERSGPGGGACCQTGQYRGAGALGTGT